MNIPPCVLSSESKLIVGKGNNKNVLVLWQVRIKVYTFHPDKIELFIDNRCAQLVCRQLDPKKMSIR